MQLTLEEAATRLGKSPRQVRYLIQQKRLAAKKIGGHWFVELDPAKTPPDSAQAGAQSRKRSRLRAAVESALDPLDLPPPAGARFSLRDLKAFQIGLPIYRQVAELLSPAHPASQALQRALEHLARGCHRFDKADKGSAYRAARDEASLAVCALLMDAQENSAALSQSVEQNLMAAVSGLLRRLDRPTKAEHG